MLGSLIFSFRRFGWGRRPGVTGQRPLRPARGGVGLIAV
jgi:hypothetical protein